MFTEQTLERREFLPRSQKNRPNTALPMCDAASPSPEARIERVQSTHDIPHTHQHIANRQADEEG
jgi:hypothetical protein